MYKLIVFLIINFAALGIGGILMGSDPSTNLWYQSLSKAPWTPPGWVFGFAWTTIMICFTIFMWRASVKFNFEELKILYTMFAIQFILNVIWNPVFFYYHFTLAGLVVILLLTIVVAWLLYWGLKNTGLNGLWVLPYFAWLLIATSLNAYVVFKN